MRKYAVPLTLLLLQGLALALAILFRFAIRPDLLAAYGTGLSGVDAFASLPWTARLALSGWFIPGSAALGALFSVLGCLPALRARVRVALLGAGLVVTVFALAFAVAAAYAPWFGQARVARELMVGIA